MKNRFLGIDLGTTYSAGAYIDDDGNARVIVNSEGTNTTPSVVYLETKEDAIVGQIAKDNSCIYPGQVVSLVKNSMGCVNPDQTPVMIKTDFGEYMPEAISSFILRKIVDDANAYLGLSGEDAITDVVVTIPAYFDDAQRKATDNAISMAGLNRLGMVNEPTAAALYYAQTNELTGSNILVYDLGGGTFDASIIHIEGGARDTVATKGLKNVGGSFFDKEIVQRICENFVKEHGIELTDDSFRSELQDLYTKVERAKIQLSSVMKTTIALRVGAVSVTYELTREELEEIVLKLYRKTEACMRQVLKDADLSVSQIDKVVLVGGCSRIPCIVEGIRNFFGKEPSRDVNPDEVVALGAAIFAKHRINDEEVTITDVNSHSIGIRAIDATTNTEFNDILIKRNSKLPASVEREYILRGKDISSLFINVFEGEYREIEDVKEICAVDVSIPVDGVSDTRVVIKLEVDKYQILHLFVRLPDEGNIEREITFARKSNISESQISEWKKVRKEKRESTKRESEKRDSKKKEGKGGFFSRMFGDKSADSTEEKTEANEENVLDTDDDIIAPTEGVAAKKAQEKREELGIPEEIEKVMADVVGMDEVRIALRDYRNRYNMAKFRATTGFMDDDSKCVAIFGESGMGISEAAYHVAKAIIKLGIVSNSVPVYASFEDIVKTETEDTVSAIQALYEKAMNGVLIIDDFHQFYAENPSSPGMQAIDLLLKAYDDAKKNVTLIVAGYSEKCKKIMEEKVKFNRLFLSCSIDLMGYSSKEYVQILHSIAEAKGYVIDDYADNAIERNIKGEMSLPSFNNIYYLTDVLLINAITDAANKAEAKGRKAGKEDYQILREENFTFSKTAKTLDELMEELDNLIGLESVKKQVHEIVNGVLVRQRAEREGKRLPGNQGALNMVFLGNPGTGKTTVAKLVSEIFREAGVLARGHLVTALRKDLVGEYEGQTAKRVASFVDEAMGGVLFIDEAYDLYRGDSEVFGVEAINTLVGLIDERRGDLIVILAGYTEKVEKLFTVNEGLQSRFPLRIEFEDYSVDEMMEIFKHMINADKFSIERKALQAVRNIIEDRHRLKAFGNGRGVRNIYEQIVRKHDSRMNTLTDWGFNEQEIIRLADVEAVEGGNKEDSFESALAELNSMIGLEKVKEQVSMLVSSARVNVRKAELGLPTSGPGTLHMLFVGNPGTGKTTVARLVGRIYKELGLIANENVIEVSKNDLVAGYVGQTTGKANKVIESAFGGVLFIDEAYQLADKDGQGDYGAEALDALLLQLDNHKKDFVCIAAGYKENMETFVRMNPGLRSRFPTTIEFEDYSVDEMCEIFKLYIEQAQYILAGGAIEAFRRRVEVEAIDQYTFGNGRGVRNIFEAVLQAQSGRIDRMLGQGVDVTSEQFMTILAEDIY